MNGFPGLKRAQNAISGLKMPQNGNFASIIAKRLDHSKRGGVAGEPKL